MKGYLSYLLELTLLFINLINANPVENLSNDDKEISKGDQYYLIYVKHNHGEYKVFPDSNIQKREASQTFIESLVDKIDSYILENKDTFENPEKLEEIQEKSQLRKRNEESDDAIHPYDEATFVMPISSVKDRVVLYAYLSETLAQDLPSKFKNVIECSPSKKSLRNAHHNYHTPEILSQTNWNDVSVRENVGSYLSLISQGKYDKNSNDEYDNNYYYPSSAGKDVDIVFIDSSFNFDYKEFSNTNDRTAKCVGAVEDTGNSMRLEPNVRCNFSSTYHGETTSVTAAGLNFGVASRANVYGVALHCDEKGGYQDESILFGVQYVYEHLIRPHRTVVNFSIGGFNPKGGRYYEQIEYLTKGITERGGIFVCSAGNNGVMFEKRRKERGNENFYYVPCEFDHVICVGGINNENGTDYKNVYEKVYYSNYSKKVDIYAPSYVSVDIVKNHSVSNIDMDGTSFSTPIVAGMVANIISENKDVQYTKNSMMDQLKQYGKNLTVRIPDGTTGLLANNGKRIIYSSKNATPMAKNLCYGQNSGYSCCNQCTILYSDDKGEWGVENEQWCGIRYACPTVSKNKWYGQESGYPPCISCQVVFEDQTGKYGVENNDWCGIKYSCPTNDQPSNPENKNLCSGQESNFSCCNDCTIASVDSSGKWGIENNQWCSIKYSCSTYNNEWYGQELGYPPCNSCKAVTEDNTGKYGVENNNWCGIRFTC